jgi:hypothetical protein
MGWWEKLEEQQTFDGQRIGADSESEARRLGLDSEALGTLSKNGSRMVIEYIVKVGLWSNEKRMGSEPMDSLIFRETRSKVIQRKVEWKSNGMRMQTWRSRVHAATIPTLLRTRRRSLVN